MPITNLQEKFLYELADIYDAEHRFLEAQQQMLEEASGQELQGMIQTHIEQTQQQQQAFQQMAQEMTNSYMQLFNIPVSYAQQGLQTAQRATAEVPIEGYDDMTVAEVVERLDSLSADELQRVRDYERRNKGRDTLLEQIDRKINAAS